MNLKLWESELIWWRILLPYDGYNFFESNKISIFFLIILYKINFENPISFFIIFIISTYIGDQRIIEPIGLDIIVKQKTKNRACIVGGWHAFYFFN